MNDALTNLDINCPARNYLEQVFGVPFQLIRQIQSDSSENPERLGSAPTSDDGQVCVRQQTDGLWQVTVSDLETLDGIMTATGVVSAVDEPSILRLVDVAREMADKDRTIDGLNEELGYFIQQVSGDLEEACWFRQMAEHVAACRADEPLEVLCDRILPQLRNLLFAQSVLVLRESSSSDGGIEVVGIDETANGDWLNKAGQIVERCRSRADDGCVIFNADFRTDHSDLPDGVDACILVRIGTPTQRFGWLVAVGRTDALGIAGQTRGSESEFGTHEATLMESAAVLLATHAANCELFAEQEKTLVGVVTAMVNALDARDPYTRGHSHRVAMIGQRLAREIGLTRDEEENIYLTGLLHDIGKIGVPDHVLLKNGPLNTEERQQIEQHTVTGHAILKPVRQLESVLPGVLHHHERMDGAGYPERLKGQDIPLAGRILAVADAFDAMTTSRPYRNAMPVVEAVQILLEGVGTHWDEVVVDAFFRCLADIHQIYERHNRGEIRQPTSLLQYGRFEDVSHNRLAALAELTGSEV